MSVAAARTDIPAREPSRRTWNSPWENQGADLRIPNRSEKAAAARKKIRNIRAMLSTTRGPATTASVSFPMIPEATTTRTRRMVPMAMRG